MSRIFEVTISSSRNSQNIRNQMQHIPQKQGIFY